MLALVLGHFHRQIVKLNEDLVLDGTAVSSGLEATTSPVVMTGSGRRVGWSPGSGWGLLLLSPAWRRTAWCGESARPGTAWWSQTAAATGTTSASSSYSPLQT